MTRPSLEVWRTLKRRRLQSNPPRNRIFSINTRLHDLEQGALSSINPTFTRVRLAQRIPVTVRITHVPPGVLVSDGVTCTAVMKEGRFAKPAFTAEGGATRHRSAWDRSGRSGNALGDRWHGDRGAVPSAGLSETAPV
jgi:hypothetical protein